MPGTGWARCPGTCGEWVQGAREGIPFLIDCPIDRFTEVIAENTFQGWDIPPGKEKVGQALRFLNERMEIRHQAKIRFLRELPVGKGMASSTADIVSAAAAYLAAQGVRPSGENLASLALGIEPSDSVMFPGITEISHVHGSYHKELGPVVPANFLAMDWGGEVDTLYYNARQDLAAHYRKHEQNIRRAAGMLYEGINNRDLEKMALAGSISAACNQEINPKPFFDEFRRWVLVQGGLGVVTAHSGTLIAGVFPPDINLEKLRDEAGEKFTPEFMDIFAAQDGGVEFSGNAIE